MGIYYKDENYTLYEGKMEEVLKALEAESIDSIVTDPPYELNFMGKGWDNSGIAFQPDTWKKCYEVLKPGGYLLAFGGSRTFHRIACAIEDAGFEIRDTIMWLYGSGFPKSMNVGLAIDKKNGVDNRTGNIVKGVGSNNTNSMKNGLGESQEFASEYEERFAQNEWSGWGTCLKPAYEPIIVARKPLCGSVVDNIIKYGVGGLNIDECRVGTELRTQFSGRGTSQSTVYNSFNQENAHWETVLGRFPANVITDGSEEVASGMPTTKSNGGLPNYEPSSATPVVDFGVSHKSGFHFDDEGSAMRYFYCAKASKKDRDEGLEDFEDVDGGSYNFRVDGSLDGLITIRKNIHPTVKPTELMQYLVRLVTPEGGVVLDPFNGSGSTGKACMFENRERDSKYYYIGIEMTEEYLPIAKARIDYAIHKFEYDAIKADEEMKATGQMNLFDFEEE